MEELSIVVALLVVYNLYLTLKISNIRKVALSQTGKLTTELIKKSMPLISAKLNNDLTIAVNRMEKIIIDYIDQHTDIPVPELEKERTLKK